MSVLPNSLIARRVFWYALLTLGVVPLGDSAHVRSGTTFYQVHNGPKIGEAPLWFLVAVLIGLLVAAEIRGYLSKRLGDEGSAFQFHDAVSATCAVLMIYLASSLMRQVDLAWSTALLGSAAMLMWSRLDRTRTGLWMGVITSFSVGAEILCVKLGLIGYAPDIGLLFGVAPWLPALYFSIGVAISIIDRVIVDRVSVPRQPLNQR